MDVEILAHNLYVNKYGVSPKNISLSFFSEALVEDIILDLVIIDNNIDIKITNISGTSETSFTVKGTSAVELKKDSKYKFEFSFWGFHWGYTKLNFAMKKREIIIATNAYRQIF